ncbi:hypothetical protein VSS74_04125 [Conexibacter stalactiti]|uniref:Uncharacterized protein n=1 Tax=Conexibacter stalactiti TaxID=1940611 RepID=A0ABU4HLR6_9ACTN|nr:hypothetical protein [Conexibacter stalactiti]MDW5593510.1 hypothetical protein [Conexibacter stalactiti]MEC5034151.1 hypothetical protein [Conexibacter stalactiti]
MKIGYSGRDDTANGHYRVMVPMAEMRRRGHKVISTRDQPLDSAPDWDVFHVHQWVSEDASALWELQSRGVGVVWDTDDDVRNAPMSRELRRVLGGRRAVRRFHRLSLEIARSVDLMTTTNEHLASLYREQGVERIKVMPNLLWRSSLPGRRRKHVGVVIGLVAAGEHVPDLEKLKIAKVLQAIQRAHDHVSVVMLGCDLKLRERYVHVPWVPFDDLLGRVRDFDIGLAPLVDSPFSRARSDIKLKEYAAAGVPWLASPVGPYAGLGEAQGGLLVADSDWFDAIDALVRDPYRRAELAGRARAWAKTQTVAGLGGEWERAFREAAVHARGAARDPVGGGTSRRHMRTSRNGA